MATITATVLTMDPPASVQVALAALTVGQTYKVTGTTADGFEWDVPGGDSTAESTSQVLVDNRAPLNGPISYRAVINGTTTITSNTVTVSAPGIVGVLQDLTGTELVAIDQADLSDPRTFDTRVGVHRVSGRMRPPTRYDTWTNEQSQLTIDAGAVTTKALLGLLSTGAPVVKRTNVGVLDVAPSEILQVIGAPKHSLYGTQQPYRTWVLTVLIIDDPEPGVALSVFDWTDFDTVYAAFTWNGFDTEWSAKTWDDFDKYDWGTRL